MWAAANDGAASRRRRHRDKQRRSDDGGKDNDITADGVKADARADLESDDSDISSDGERSTTESIDDNAARSATQSQSDNAGNNSAEAAARHKKRKRKRKRKKKKTPIRPEETPEATMARLKSSYSAAIAAVGALHRVSRQYCAVWGEEEGREKTTFQGSSGGEVDEANVIEQPGNDIDEENALKERGVKEREGGDTEANSETTNIEEKQREAHSTIQRVANAARMALEQSLLLDNVILAPIILPSGKANKKGKKTSNGGQGDVYENNNDHMMERMSSAWLNAWNSPSRTQGACQISLSKWNRLSAAHRTVVKQISYLALVNYADLLLCGCTYRRSQCAATDDGQKRGDILDRGAVSNLDFLELFSSVDKAGGPNDDGVDNSNGSSNNGHFSYCLWSNESPERTIRLALAAYCDASELDPSDPTMWFKLASAARALGREIDFSSSLASVGPPRSYRCLERLALERGMSSLPTGVPPNRLLMRAWREMENWDQRPTVINVTQVTEDATEEDGTLRMEDERPIELVLHLPRYSWVTLGRILLRACREGASYGRSMSGALRHHHVWSTNCQSPEDYEFGSPLVDVRISPLLAVPHNVLGRICEYLKDIKRLICTCRAMHSELVSARARVPDEKKQTSRASDKEKDVVHESVPDVPVGDAAAAAASRSRESQSEADLTPTRRERVSKRVRHQMIATEKQAERKSKRKSVEYCLLAGTLSCTAQHPHYNKLLLTDFNWECLPLIKKSVQQLHAPSQAQTTSNSTEASLRSSSNQTSLNTFVANWSRNNSGPRHLLEAFLLHVSINTEDIFETEMTESLSSCVIDCFDMLAEGHTEFAPWYGPEAFEEEANLDRSRQILAVNLLNAELRVKRFESRDVGSQEHQEDSDALAFIVPNLLQFLSAMFPLEDETEKACLLRLKCRCFWLATRYYLWVGRCSNDASFSKAAEDFGLEYLKQTKMLLSEVGNNLSIKTPHLESLDCRGTNVLSHDALSKYEEHLQSSSIVSRARQCFQEVQERYVSATEGDDTGDITADERAKLAQLGVELLERYNVGGEKSRDALEELLSDFLLLHEDQLLAVGEDSHSSQPASAGAGEVHWGSIWGDVPSSQAEKAISVSNNGSRPSIMQVLSSSIVVSEERTSMFLIFAKVIVTALRLRSQAFEQSKPTDVTEDDGSCIDVTKKDCARRQYLLTLVVNFFTDKMTDFLSSYATEADMKTALEAFVEGEDLCHVIFSSLNMACLVDSSILQSRLFHSASKLVLALRHHQELSTQGRERVESVYFVALVKALFLQKTEFADLIGSCKDKRVKTWQLKLTSKADLIFSTANEVAELLSLNASTLNVDGSVSVSHLMKAIAGLAPQTASPLAKLSDALLFWWNFLNNKLDASSPTENAVKSRLMVPISSAIIALCGSLGASVEDSFAKSSNKSDDLSFSDYFDSEDSVNGSFLPGGSGDKEDQRRRRVLLRKFCQLAQCVDLVFNSVDKKLIHQESTSPPFPSSRHGPFLPLVVVRVLSNMSNRVFELFSEDVGGKAYPFGARECGRTIDRLLGSAYVHLHGFSFTGADPDTSNNYAPESIGAAWQLFRCITRVYQDSRRAPPLKAYETVKLALPPAEESRSSKAIKAFLFNGDKNIDELTNSTNDIPPGFPTWVLDETENVSLSSDADERSIEMLRRRVCHELAGCDLDSTQKSPSEMDDKGLSEERESAQSDELSHARKVQNLLDDLCYNPNNVEGWMSLNESLAFKAEGICDRLVPIQEAYDSSDFYPQPESKRNFPASMSLDELHKSQLEEFQETRRNWNPFIGNNLYSYVQYPWSNLSSLEALSNHIADTEGFDVAKDEHNVDYCCWKEIDSKLREGNYICWANSWAGMFVMALRTMRMKALMVARFLAKKGQDGMHPSEVSEDIGTALYGDLMASTVYGYPIHPMTLYEKRKIAESSKFYFQEAIQLSTSSEYKQKSQISIEDGMFMIGKCCGKIAATLKEEKYSSDSHGGNVGRSYENVMIDAVNNYSNALAHARKAGLSSSDTGGSSHGALECLYRLHASRFKVFLSAIKRVKEERALAELEAFRIASIAWFDESNDQSLTNGVRGKTWDIYSDCVDALCHCRTEVPSFHRVAYRLAQAYNWAPIFHNPDCDLNMGSRQAVPAIKSYRIRGLDTGSCAESASIAISKLFEKKRAQLAAVWVTTSTAPTPFEVLNDSLRKYDALRLKYVRAYIDSMRLCGHRDKIETLLNWSATTNQDLPSFYEASAHLSGGDPGKHTKQSLLCGSGNGFITQVKRSATSALAEIILKDLDDMKRSGVDSEGKIKLAHLFNQAYALFLRLNSSCKEVVEFSRPNELPEVEALCKCYLSIQAGYRISAIRFDDGIDGEFLGSILEGAISKAKELMQEAKSKKDKE